MDKNISRVDIRHNTGTHTGVGVHTHTHTYIHFILHLSKDNR